MQRFVGRATYRDASCAKGGIVIGYRLFLMKGSHVLAAKEFFAESDEAAIVRAKELREAQSAELWCRARVVSRFEAKQDA